MCAGVRAQSISLGPIAVKAFGRQPRGSKADVISMQLRGHQGLCVPCIPKGHPAELCSGLETFEKGGVTEKKLRNVRSEASAVIKLHLACFELASVQKSNEAL